MNRDVLALRYLLADHDPGRLIPAFDPAEDPAAAAAFRSIIVTPRPHLQAKPHHTVKPLGRRLSPALVAALVLVVALIAVSLGTQRSANPAYAATPAMLDYRLTVAEPAGQVLERAAQAADAQPVLAPIGRGFWYLRTANWHLVTSVSAKTTSVVRPTIQELWVGADGSARVLEATSGPIASGDGSLASERDAVSALPSPATAKETSYGPGEYSTAKRALSGDPAVLAQQLLSPNNAEIPDNVETLLAITNRLRQQPVPPALLGAMYRVLAGLPGVEDAGVVTDRAGRAGVAVAIESAYSGLPTRYVLIVDPRTGAPLASEQILTTDAGKLNVPIPSVSSYTTYVSAGIAPGSEVRP